MRYAVCSIRDSAADNFDRPFCAPSLGVAIRSFSDEVKRDGEGNMFFKHPEHFELFHLGWFDDAAADFEIFAKPKSLLCASDARSI